ncbi:hypothetical protein [Bacillus sp. CECT 9360]|nr:hypothetical protein [Bacillus sp. CECT 9360]CAH0346083.1 hypothetical protein BCI9360_02401 [Bacillus sp. CECT 9360]
MLSVIQTRYRVKYCIAFYDSWVHEEPEKKGTRYLGGRGAAADFT